MVFKFYNHLVRTYSENKHYKKYFQLIALCLTSSTQLTVKSELSKKIFLLRLNSLKLCKIMESSKAFFSPGFNSEEHGSTYSSFLHELIQITYQSRVFEQNHKISYECLFLSTFQFAEMTWFTISASYLLTGRWLYCLR